MTFKQKVFAAVKKIPRGGTLSYKQVAEMAGSPLACRAVGNILRANYDPAIPCHRVVRSDGKTGGYNRGAEAKKEILKSECGFCRGVPCNRPDWHFNAGENMVSPLRIGARDGNADDFRRARA